ncbi:MAG: hypothetical protein HC918_12085 [Oscillatoriales cyanobacterium SM2_1_8]|nr:hypothetical protein [Oscillatoriales cyanobacterium SM2_1_8]
MAKFWLRWRAGHSSSPSPPWQPLDWGTLVLALLLTVAIGITLWVGDRTRPVVRHFSWQGQEVRAGDRFFVLEFNRPMDRESVQTNLKIEPALPGKFSWSGLRMAYTPLAPVPYGQSFTLSLANAFDRFAAETGEAKPLVPFAGKFATPPPAFLYLGTAGSQAGRLLRYDLKTGQSQPVTDRPVVDFKPTGDGQRAIVAIEGGAGAVGSAVVRGAVDGGGAPIADRQRRLSEPQI